MGWMGWDLICARDCMAITSARYGLYRTVACCGSMDGRGEPAIGYPLSAFGQRTSWLFHRRQELPLFTLLPSVPTRMAAGPNADSRKPIAAFCTLLRTHCNSRMTESWLFWVGFNL